MNVFAYPWNNIWELGNGDRAHKLANADYQVIISHASYFYFDHPVEPDPEERGLYWAARYVDTLKSWSYIPDNIYANIDFDTMGNMLTTEQICAMHGCPPLEESKRKNIIGMQGQLWSEVVRTSTEAMEMIFPRLIALAERSWHKASWEYTSTMWNRTAEYLPDWTNFTNTLGYKEMIRLDNMGVTYAVPPPGARLVGNMLEVNCMYPGLPIHYSLDSGTSWTDYVEPIFVGSGAEVLLRTRSADRSRYSRQVQFLVPDPSVKPQKL